MSGSARGKAGESENGVVPRGRSISTFAKVLLCVGGIAAAILGAEGVARWREGRQFRVSHLTRHHALRPMSSGDSPWGDSKYSTAVNSLGMRDEVVREAPLAKPGVRRVLFLGDSFTEGVGVEFEDTAVHQAEEALRRIGATPIECLNGGVASYSPAVELVALREWLDAGLRVDFVVVMLDESDPQDEVFYASELGRGSAQTSNGTSHPTWFVWLHEHSALARRFLQRTPEQVWRDPKLGLGRQGFYEDRVVWAHDPELIEKWGKQGVRLMETSLRRMKTLLDERRIPMSVVLYPWPGDRREDDHSFYEASALEVCRRANIPVINLFPVFRERQDWNELFIAGDVHWTVAGHHVAGQAISAALRPLLGDAR